MHSTSLPWARGIGVGAVVLGATLVAVTASPLGCESTVDKVDGSSSGSTGSSTTTDMCSGAASIEGDGAGCPCGVDMCGFCQACDPCMTTADCTSQSGVAKCIHSDHQCGKGLGGDCIDIPPGDCQGIGVRVCLCDGGVNTLDCATAAGQDISDDLTPCLGGTFACGDKTCDAFVEYCRTFSGGPAPGTTTYDCVPVPDTCSTGIGDCNCISEPGGMCSIDVNGQVQVQILAP